MVRNERTVDPMTKKRTVRTATGQRAKETISVTLWDLQHKAFMAGAAKEGLTFARYVREYLAPLAAKAAGATQAELDAMAALPIIDARLPSLRAPATSNDATAGGTTVGSGMFKSRQLVDAFAKLAVQQGAGEDLLTALAKWEVLAATSHDLARAGELDDIGAPARTTMRPTAMPTRGTGTR